MVIAGVFFCADNINQLLLLAFYSQSFYCTYNNISVAVTNSGTSPGSLSSALLCVQHTHTQGALAETQESSGEERI